MQLNNTTEEPTNTSTVEPQQTVASENIQHKSEKENSDRS